MSKRVAGILIGGKGARLGGVAKGMLLAPDGIAIAARTRDLFLAEGVRVVLLGKNAAYDALGLASLCDAPEIEGPLAGLCALVNAARATADRIFLIGADMPFLTTALVRKLTTTTSRATAPRRTNRWEPLFSSFKLDGIQDDFDRAVKSGVRSPSAILDALHADALPLTRDEAHALRDWDTDEDIARDTKRRGSSG